MDNNSAMHLDRAGRLLAAHAICWVRYLPASLERVWDIVSTKAGLAHWWIVAPTVFELEQGGRFQHHWENRIADFEPLRFIDIDEPAGSYTGTGGMRFELTPIDSNHTRFMFLATFGPAVVAPAAPADLPAAYAAQPAGPGTVWPSVAAGWHGTLDRLERHFNPNAPTVSETTLCDFYVGFLHEQLRLLNMVQRLPLETHTA